MALWAAVFWDKIPLSKAIDRYSSERWHYARGMAKTQLNKNARARVNTACSKNHTRGTVKVKKKTVWFFTCLYRIERFQLVTVKGGMTLLNGDWDSRNVQNDLRNDLQHINKRAIFLFAPTSKRCLFYCGHNPLNRETRWVSGTKGAGGQNLKFLNCADEQYSPG